MSRNKTNPTFTIHVISEAKHRNSYTVDGDFKNHKAVMNYLKNNRQIREATINYNGKFYENYNSESY